MRDPYLPSPYSPPPAGYRPALAVALYAARIRLETHPLLCHPLHEGDSELPRYLDEEACPDDLPPSELLALYVKEDAHGTLHLWWQERWWNPDRQTWYVSQQALTYRGAYAIYWESPPASPYGPGDTLSVTQPWAGALAEVRP